MVRFDGDDNGVDVRERRCIVRDDGQLQNVARRELRAPLDRFGARAVARQHANGRLRAQRYAEYRTERARADDADYHAILPVYQ